MAEIGRIYLITNLVNNKKYVGQTKQPVDRRWKRHIYDAKVGNQNMPVHKAMMKYGLQKKCGKKVNRPNTTLSHYTFRKRLQHTALQQGCKIVIVNESYTSKGCTKCGNINGCGRDRFKCRKCGLKIDRDYQGARNILLKAITQLKTGYEKDIRERI